MGRGMSRRVLRESILSLVLFEYGKESGISYRQGLLEVILRTPDSDAAFLRSFYR